MVAVGGEVTSKLRTAAGKVQLLEPIDPEPVSLSPARARAENPLVARLRPRYLAGTRLEPFKEMRFGWGRAMDVADRLRSAKLRPTRQRHVLARLLFTGGHRHVTAEQLHGEALAAEVRVSLATVYNTLHHFTRVGLLRELVVESGRSYFDTNTTHHHHFFDEKSGELTDIPGQHIRVSRVPRPPAGFAVSRVDVVVRLRGDDVENID